MYNYVDLQDTIVAMATPAGSGAIGVVRLSGKDAVDIVNRCFKAKDLTQVPTHTIHLGYVRDEQNKVIDQALVSVFHGPNSYTKENVVEVSCHGSRFIQQQLLELFVRHGARLAKEGEFTMRAFLNGQMDLSQAEAVADLINAESESAHQMALQQMRGGFSDQIADLREQLVNFASLIELELDFGEEDVEFADRDDLRGLINKIQLLIKRLLDSFQLGNAIKHGVNTVIAGRPNAGKSTLLNALLNEERAIVSNIAGTTRDTIEEVLNIKGVQFRLVDTAGIRAATDQIEAIGVEKTFEKIKQSAILVYVYDAHQMTQADVEEDLNQLQKEGMQVLVLANKIDHVGNPDALPAPHFKISAKVGVNIEQIKDTLYELVAQGNLNSDQTLVSNTRHYSALQRSMESLDSVLNGLEVGITGDFLAMDIRHTLNSLGEITGQISTDDLLGNIFSNFCIGK